MRQDISTEDAQAMMEKTRWFHKIPLGDGLETPGSHGIQKLITLHMPVDLTGWTVLDVGANDGYFSFEAERRGASRVLATDWNAWTGDRAGYPDWNLPARKTGFDTAKYLLDSNVESAITSVYDITPETVGNFDLVLFLGVLYHLWHPFLALESLAKVATKLLIVETAVLNVDYEEPVMQFVLEKHGNDPTNWWYPNPRCLNDMLLAVGFSEIKEHFPGSHPARRVFHACKEGYHLGQWELDPTPV